MNEEIKINRIGKIVEGDSKGWYIRIIEDKAKTGGYFIFLSDNKSFSDHCNDFDNWVENLNDVKSFFKESNWQVTWYDE